MEDLLPREERAKLRQVRDDKLIIEAICDKIYHETHKWLCEAFREIREE